MSDIYYDINVQIWSEKDVIYYSVIQETGDLATDPETLVYGETDSLQEALTETRESVLNALKPTTESN